MYERECVYLFKARFVVVGVLGHQRLDGDEHRRDALCRAPSRTSPGATVTHRERERSKHMSGERESMCEGERKKNIRKTHLCVNRRRKEREMWRWLIIFGL